MNEQKDTRPKQVSFCLLKYRLTISPVGVIVKKNKTMIPLELCYIALSLVTMFVLVYCYRKATLASRRWRHTAENNLGRPEELENATKKLTGNFSKALFVVISFVPRPCYGSAKQTKERIPGVALLAHPNYINSPLFFHVQFDLQEEIIADSKALYVMVWHPVEKINYLKKYEKNNI